MDAGVLQDHREQDFRHQRLQRCRAKSFVERFRQRLGFEECEKFLLRGGYAVGSAEGMIRDEEEFALLDELGGERHRGGYAHVEEVGGKLQCGDNGRRALVEKLRGDSGVAGGAGVANLASLLERCELGHEVVLLHGGGGGFVQEEQVDVLVRSWRRLWWNEVRRSSTVKWPPAEGVAAARRTRPRAEGKSLSIARTGGLARRLSLLGACGKMPNLVEMRT